MITANRLRDLVVYDPLKGSFVWRLNKGRSRKGTRAGRIRPDGYYALKIDGRDYLSHRLAWFYIYGTWPIEIDHKNGKRADFRLSNLRECTRSQNFANRKPKPNKVLPKGVRQFRHRFQARIVVRGKEINLGMFDTKEAASSAYLSAAIFAYGEFARGSHNNGNIVQASRAR